MKAAYLKASSCLSAPAAIVFGVSVVFAGSAVAQNAGYAFTSLGVAYSADQELNGSLTEFNDGYLGARTLDIDWDDVKSFSAGFGFQGQKTSLRYELGLEHFADFDLSGFDDQQTHYREAYNASTVMASAYYDLPFGSELFKPYIGAGIGVTANSGNGMTMSNLLVDAFEDRQVATSQSNLDVAWQAGAGVAIPLTRKTSLDLGYRYTDLGKAKTGDTFTGAEDSGTGRQVTGGSNHLDSLELKAHQAKIGLRHSLARDENRQYRLQDSVGFESSYGLGYGDYELDWTVSDYDNDPKNKSSMRIEDLDSMTFMGDWQLNYKNLIVDAKGRFSWILDGDYRASTSDETSVLTAMSGVANDDYVYTTTVGLGYEILTDANTSAAIAFRPMAGASVSEQKFRLGDSEYTAGPLAGTEAALNSTYESRWVSGWVGGEAEVIGGDFRFSMRGEFHQAVYDAKAQWADDLTLTQPVSFTHTADKAHGVNISARAERDLGNASRVFLAAEYEQWRGYNGDDTNAPLASDQSGTFDQVELEGYTIAAGLVFGL